jgi:uncharacterized protein YjbJ (UPF0337 family)
MKREDTMNCRADDYKGRIKQAAGDLTNNSSLRREGKLDQTGAKVKKTAEKLTHRVSDAIDVGKKKFNH